LNCVDQLDNFLPCSSLGAGECAGSERDLKPAQQWADPLRSRLACRRFFLDHAEVGLDLFPVDGRLWRPGRRAMPGWERRTWRLSW
jgi:hypothetical protein